MKHVFTHSPIPQYSEGSEVVIESVISKIEFYPVWNEKIPVGGRFGKGELLVRQGTERKAGPTQNSHL